MKILVCIKQVIDTDEQLAFLPGERWFEEQCGTHFCMNRYDEHALEEALLLKDKIPRVEIHALSVGPERVTRVISRALSKGADQGIHLRCGKVPLSALETASCIARYARGENFDLILAGVMSEDTMQCQVGPTLAALLSLPCAVSVTATELVDGDRITVLSELEGMMTEKMMMPLPAVVTIQSGGNTPRYPSLSNIMQAKGKTIRTIDAEAMAAAPPREEFLPLAWPPATTKGTTLTGTREQKADQLLNILHERSLL